MKHCYINGAGCLSVQKTYDNADFLSETEIPEGNVLTVKAPKYRDYISPVAARRMAKAVKMGVTAATIALREAGLTEPDAVITGSGMGCVRDSEKFLEAILDNDEQYLTPISFIQSTHNTVGAQISLTLKCKAYNVTYVQSAVSFESALLDAALLFGEGEARNVLVGGVDELGDHYVNLHQLIHHIKTDDTDRGSRFGEGAQFFVLSDRPAADSYAKVCDVDIINDLSVKETGTRIERFLERNGLKVADIDAVVLGNNDDPEYDTYYHNLQAGIFADTPQLHYKHLSGEYNTASAFGMWTAAKILKTGHIPPVLRLNEVQKPHCRNILLYNQYRGRNHSILLLQSV